MGSTMAPATDFFETCAMLITLVLFGKYLEAVVSDWQHGRVFGLQEAMMSGCMLRLSSLGVF